MTRQQKLTPHFERGECREKKESPQISSLGCSFSGVPSHPSISRLFPFTPLQLLPSSNIIPFHQ